EDEREIAVGEEVRAVEANVALRFDDRSENPGDRGDLFMRRPVRDAELEDDTSFEHSLVISDATLEEVRIRDHDLLAGEASDACRLEPDVLDRPGEIAADDDEVADHEGLVEKDDEGGEEVSEDVLRREGKSDASDA